MMNAGFRRTRLERDFSNVRPDINDLSAAWRNHDARRFLARKKHALQRRVHSSVVFVFVDVQRHRITRPARVIDEDIDSLERLYRLCKQRLKLGDAAYVRDHDQGFPSQLLDLAFHLLDLFRSAFGVFCQHEVAAGLRQSESDRLSNAFDAPVTIPTFPCIQNWNSYSSFLHTLY